MPIVSANPHTRNFFNSIGNPDHVKGDGTDRIKVSMDYRYIRYFIEQDATIVYYGEYALQSVSSDTDLYEQLEVILSKDPFLSKYFASVKICWMTDFEIIPTAFYDDTDASYASGVSDILGGEAKFLFEKPIALSSLLDRHYPTAAHYHYGAALIESIRHNGLSTSGDLFINIHSQRVEILYFDPAGTLRIYNSYEYRTYQDYIYFVLLVADEMQLDRDTTRAVLLGEINQDSQLYEMTYRYFGHTSFIKQQEEKRFSSSFEGYPMHFNYPLYNL